MSRLDRIERLLAAGDYAEAAAQARRAMRLGQSGARRLLAESLYAQSVGMLAHPDLHAASESLLLEAIRVTPDHADALNNLGSLLLLQNRPGEAIPHFARARSVAPRSRAFAENLAKAQEEAGVLADAAATLSDLAMTFPDDGGAYRIREALLFPSIAPDDAQIVEGRRAAEARLDALTSDETLRIVDPLRFPSTYFRFSYHDRSNASLCRTLAALHLRMCPELDWTAPHVGSWVLPTDRRIRIGIASRFLRAHSIGNTTRGFVERLDRRRFEVVVIRLESSPDDAIARGIDTAADRVLTVPDGDWRAMREAIAALELDVLFYPDIGMEPIGYTLAFSRLAPVQFTSFGHPDTTGVPTMDWFVSSALYEPEGAEAHYTERLSCIPEAGTLSFYHRPRRERPATRAEYGFDDADHIYCCPQMLFKLMPVMDRLFADILRRDDRAVVALIEPPQKVLRTALEARMRDAGLPMNRVRFLRSMAYDAFLGLLQVADVVLDTPGFNGQNTTLEAFAMGTPVVTLPGALQRGRHTAGMYRAMGFEALVATNEDDYAGIACRVASDKGFGQAARDAIVARCGVLYEDERFMRRFEAAVIEMVGAVRRTPG